MPLNPQIDVLIQAMLPVVKQFHEKMQLAPHAATMSNVGEISGRAIVNKDNNIQMSVSEAISHFETEFRKLSETGEITASAIFYHGAGVWPPVPAQTAEEANKIVAILEHKDGDSVYLIIPYVVSNNACEYSLGSLVEKPRVVFSEKAVSINMNLTSRPWWKIW